MEDVYNKDHFFCNLIWDRLLSYIYERPLNASHLKPIEDFLLEGKELTPFSQELFTYQEARKCVLDFDIYTMQENYDKFPNTVDFLMDCYRYAAQEGVMEAYNNIGVYLGMTNRIEEAVLWFEGAANAGLATGMTNLMAYYGSKGDSDRQFFYAEKLAEIGNPAGMWNCAVSYHFGYMGREKDIEKARNMYQRMMLLVLENDKNELDFDSGQLLSLKTYANYNLAKIRMLTEEQTEENLKDILNLMEHTPYVCLDRPKNIELREEIQNLL
ncbi:MAG: sel1 repeat family protein [Prevotella sp.]|nr:sel1 repeat family protein [Prevotella sp.]